MASMRTSASAFAAASFAASFGAVLTLLRDATVPLACEEAAGGPLKVRLIVVGATG